MSVKPFGRMVLYCKDGIPEIGVPADCFLIRHANRMDWAVYHPRSYDHGVIWNRLEMGELVEVIPGPGVAELVQIAVEASQDHPIVQSPNEPRDPPPTPLRRALRVIRGGRR